VGAWVGAPPQAVNTTARENKAAIKPRELDLCVILFSFDREFMVNLWR